MPLCGAMRLRYETAVGNGFRHPSGRVIALGRLMLATLFVIAIAIDVSQPTHYPKVAFILLGGYVVFAAAIVASTWRDWWLDAKLTGPAHAIDIAVFAALVLLTEGFTSPFFTFFIFLLRQFFLSIPLDLSDAARIDGASELGIFSRIVLPLAKPALVTVALFTFLSAWNDFLGPLIFLNDGSKYTLAVGLAAFRGQNRTQWDLMMAAATVVTMPIVIVFFFAQKQFIQGIALTGMKG